MNVKKTIGSAGLIAFFAVLLLTGIGFMLASMRPEDYRPYQLTKELRQRQVAKFVNKHALPFRNNFIKPDSFNHTITEDEMNLYLASLDEIAQQRPDAGSEKSAVRENESVHDAMDKNGLADPVVKFVDDKIRVMIRSKNHADKIITLDIKMQLDDESKLKISLDGVKIGRLPVPKSVVEASLNLLRESLKDSENNTDFTSMENVIAKVFQALDDKPVETVLTLSKRSKKISDIKIADGSLTIFYVPVSKSN